MINTGDYSVTLGGGVYFMAFMGMRDMFDFIIFIVQFPMKSTIIF